MFKLSFSKECPPLIESLIRPQRHYLSIAVEILVYEKLGNYCYR